MYLALLLKFTDINLLLCRKFPLVLRTESHSDCVSLYLPYVDIWLQIFFPCRRYIWIAFEELLLTSEDVLCIYYTNCSWSTWGVILRGLGEVWLWGGLVSCVFAQWISAQLHWFHCIFVSVRWAQCFQVQGQNKVQLYQSYQMFWL